MQRDAIRMRSQLECRRLMHILMMANDRTVEPAADGIIFAEPGTCQQERPAAPAPGLTIPEFLWHMMLPSE
jgi:hypothetical protein